MPAATSSLCPLSRWTASRAMWGRTAPAHASRASTPPTGPAPPARRVAPRRSSPLTSWTSTRAAAPCPATRSPRTLPSRRRWRRASPTSSRPTSAQRSPTSRRTWRRAVRWTACSAATWALARRRSPCAQPSSAVRTPSRSWCSVPPPSWRSSTLRRSSRALCPLTSRWPCSRAL